MEWAKLRGNDSPQQLSLHCLLMKFTRTNSVKKEMEKPDRQGAARRSQVWRRSVAEEKATSMAVCQQDNCSWVASGFPGSGSDCFCLLSFIFALVLTHELCKKPLVLLVNDLPFDFFRYNLKITPSPLSTILACRRGRLPCCVRGHC